MCLCPDSVLLCPITLKWKGGKRHISLSVGIKPVFRHRDLYTLDCYRFKIFLSNLHLVGFAKIWYVTLQVKGGQALLNFQLKIALI
jgi:hypothetical protein